MVDGQKHHHQVVLVPFFLQLAQRVMNNAVAVISAIPFLQPARDYMTRIKRLKTVKIVRVSCTAITPTAIGAVETERRVFHHGVITGNTASFIVKKLNQPAPRW